MIDLRWVFATIVILGLLTKSMIPGVIVAVGVTLISFVRPKWIEEMTIRWSWCFQTAILIFILLPYATCLMPHGGDYEQEWLDRVIAHLESRECDDPKMQEIIDYTIRRYNRIGPLCVRVVQLPETVAGMNNPFAMGLDLDESMLDYDISIGAEVLVHEAMHDYWPHFGHSHIDDDRIMEAVK